MNVCVGSNPTQGRCLFFLKKYKYNNKKIRNYNIEKYNKYMSSWPSGPKAPDLSSGTRKCAWVRTPHLTEANFLININITKKIRNYNIEKYRKYVSSWPSSLRCQI